MRENRRKVRLLSLEPWSHRVSMSASTLVSMPKNRYDAGTWGGVQVN